MAHPKRPHNEKEWRYALKLLDKVINPSGTWRDDEARRLAKQFLKRWKQDG